MRGKRAFTFVEMLMGLVIMAMIMLAIAAVMTSVADGWNDQDVAQSTQLSANQVYARVQNILSQAKYVIIPSAGSSGSSILFWANDDFGGTSDSTIEAGELALITLDTSNNTLYLYAPISTSSMSSSQYAAAGTQLDWSQVRQITPAEFESWSYVQATPLGGPGSQSSSSSSGLQVTGAQFYVCPSLSSTSQLPVVEFTLSMTRNGQSVTLYNSSTLRCPATQPN